MVTNNVIEFYLHQSLFILFTGKTRPQGKSSLLVIFVNGTFTDLCDRASRQKVPLLDVHLFIQ